MNTTPHDPEPMLLLAAAMPPDPSARGFASSARGTEILTAIHAELGRARPPRIRIRRRTAVVLALAALTATTAAAVATAIVIQPENPTGGGCLKTLDLQADLALPAGDIPYNDPAPVCSAQWTVLFPGAPQPDNFINCVYPQGGLVAAPAPRGTDPAQACAAIGAGTPG